MAVLAAIGMTAVFAAGTARPADAASTAASACPVQWYGHNGEYICGTTKLELKVPDGDDFLFVVGLDHSVWIADSTIDPYGFGTLGGQASNLYCAWSDQQNNMVIQVWGPQGTDLWCRYFNFNPAGWGSWFECNGWGPPDNSFDRNPC